MKMVHVNYAARYLVMALVAMTLSPDAHAQSRRVSPPAAPVAREVVQAVPMPSPELQVVLVRTVIGTLNDANMTGDYSLLLKRGSEGFRQVNTVNGLALGFAQFQEQKLDLAGSVLYPIVWSQAPIIEGSSLRLVGAIDSRPQPVLFDLGFQMDDGQWKLAALSVGLAPPTP